MGLGLGLGLGFGLGFGLGLGLGFRLGLGVRGRHPQHKQPPLLRQLRRLRLG